MAFIMVFCLLLISGLLATTAGNSYIDCIENDVLTFIVTEGFKVSCAEGHNLKLLEGGKLGKTDHALVWKGLFDDKTKVAVKILLDDEFMDEEMIVFKALNAATDKNIEKHGIARVYYHGPVLNKYYAIAMTLFDGSFVDKIPKGGLSEINTLKIFRQAVEVLQFLHTNKVVHNDIKPANLFIRGAEIFIGDFDMATVNGSQHRGNTEMFASSNFFANKDRQSMDDLESLVFSMWNVAGVPLVENKPYGRTLSECTEQGDAEAKVKEICKHFKNEHVRKVFQDIFVSELLTKKIIPKYKAIIEKLTGAIDKAKGKTEMAGYSWLKRKSMENLRHEPIYVKA